MAFYLDCSRYLTFSVLGVFFIALAFETVDSKNPFSFSFERFDKNLSFDSEIALSGDAEICDFTVGITRPVNGSTGRVFYKKPIRFLGMNPGFSTSFSFSIAEGGGERIAFLLVPNSVYLKSKGNSSALVSVEFAPVVNRIEIGIDGGISTKSSDLSNASLVLNSGKELHSWIDYDGVSKRLEVRLSKSRALKPSASLISSPIDLSSVLWREAMFIGISSSNGNSTKVTTLYSWSFVVKHGAPYLMHSEPLDPDSLTVHSDKGVSVDLGKNYHWKLLMALLFGFACGAFVACAVLFLRSAFLNRHPVAPVECPVNPGEIEYKKVALAGDNVAK